MTDAKIEEIYVLADAALRHGQPFFHVHVFPFRMTPERLQNHDDSPWFHFWGNLQEGYAYFERYRHPPSIGVQNKRYIFH
jgi:murein L,D-transpeptidase YafK